MTRLSGYARSAAADHARAAAAGQKTRDNSSMGLLGDPRVRLGLGTAMVVVTALAARRDRIGHGEAQTFWAVNDLPESLYSPVWVIMQLGAFGAVPAAAGAALLAHDRELARRLLAGGTGTWALAKLVKQMVRRPRPVALVSGARTRGPRCFRARVPVGACGRGGCPGRGCPPAAESVPARCGCRSHAARWPLSHLRGRSPPAGCCGRSRTRARHRGSRGLGLASARP